MKNISFEESLEKLESVIKDLESGNVPLEDAIEKYTEAMKLVKSCQEKLEKANEQVNKIVAENGKLEDFSEDIEDEE